MTMHSWGEENFDWNVLNDAIHYVVCFCRRWGRLPLHGKEKWGVMRLEGLYFGFSIIWLIWPGYMYCPKNCPKWLWTLDQHLAHYWPLWNWPLYRILFNWWFIPYQVGILKLAHKRAVKKWPHLKAEIMDEYDWVID